MKFIQKNYIIVNKILLFNDKRKDLPMVYLDNAATTFPKMKSLYNETMKIYENIGFNFSRNNSSQSDQMSHIFQKLKNNLKEILSLDNNYEIILNSSATFSANEILNGLDYNTIKTIYISPFEHNAIFRTLKHLQTIFNFSLEIIPFENFNLDINKLVLNFSSKNPDLIVCTHASNVFGNILPIEKIFSEGKKYKAITILDGAQTVGTLNFKEISSLCDFIIFAGHKNLYGPSGIGGYSYNTNIPLKPLVYGGTGIKSEEIEMPKDIPEKFQAGSPNSLGIIGLYLSTEELLKISSKEIYKRKLESLDLLREVLENYDYDLTILSPKENNIGIISVTSQGHSPQEIEKLLDSYHIATRVGLHCAPLAHDHMGTLKNGGTIRFSIGYFNNQEDFDILDDALNEIL
ncbi:MAG: aminotransferase class V-fold PLP-dependent enzyme [Cetobacterium sp.]|uniref:aminotransferase class V-fold PLP-dependent enzyme n=1 Tax=Cetobacterium sp. TaxID=2071632 RepID=UPI003F35FAA0